MNYFLFSSPARKGGVIDSMSTKEENRYLKEPLVQKTIHGERSLSEDGSYNVKFVDVGGEIKHGGELR